jgi:hypothetical protein
LIFWQDGAIRDFCRTFGLDYAPVSELDGSDSAYAALFWDPRANWIVLAFKGTSPTEYAGKYLSVFYIDASVLMRGIVNRVGV